MDQFYFVDDYITVGYYGLLAQTDVSVSAQFSLSADVKIANATSYFIEDYIVDSYFVAGTTQDATADLIHTISTVAIAVKQVSVNSTMLVVSSFASTISHIEGADLFALSDAALLLTVARLRDHNCAVNSQFNMATDFVVSRSAVADANAIVIAIVNALRSRDVTLDALAAFSIAVSVVPLQKQGASDQSSVFTQTALIDGVIQAAAVLVSTATQTTATSRTRDQLSVLTSTVSVNCLAINLQGYDIVATDFATVTCVAVKTTSAVSAVQVSVSQSAVAVKQSQGTSFIRGFFGVFVSRGAGPFYNPDVPRPIAFEIPGNSNHQFVQSGDSLIYTTGTAPAAKYGTRSLYLTNNTSLQTVNAEPLYFLPQSNQQFVLEFFLREQGGLQVANAPNIVSIGASTYQDLANATNAFNFGFTLQSGQSRLTFRYRNNSTNQMVNLVASSGSQAPSSSAWNHYAVVRGSDNVIRLYFNGNQVASGSYSGAIPQNLTPNNTKIHIRARDFGASGDGAYFDEFSYRLGRSEIQGFSQGIKQDPDTQVALLHFENDLVDDTTSLQTVDHEGAAALVSSAIITAKLGAPVRATAGLTAASSLSALGGKLNSIDLVAGSDGILIVTGDKIKLISSALTSDTVQSTVIAVVRNTGSVIDSVATVIASADRIRLIELNQQAQFTQTTVSEKTADAGLTINAQVSMVTVAARIRFGASNQTAQFQLISLIDIIRSANSNQSAEFTHNTVAVKTVNTASSVNAEASFTATISHIEGADLVAFGLAAINATVSRTRPFESQVNVVTEITTNATKNTTNNSTISVDTVLTGSVTRIQSASVTLVLTSSNTTQANVVLVSDVNMTTVATVTVSAEKTVNVNAGLSSPTQIITQAQVTRDVIVVLLTNSAVTCVISVTKLALVTLLVASDHVTQIAVQRTATVNFMVASVTSVIGNKFQGTVVVIDTVLSVSVAYERLRQTPVPVFSTVTVTVLAAKTVPALTTLVCDSNLACVISHIEGADLVSNIFATVSVSANKVMFGTAGLINTAVMAVAANELVGVTANTVCVATITVIGTRVQQAAATITAQHTVATVAEVTRATVIALSSVSTVGCVISHIEGADIVINNFATVSVVAGRVQSAVSSMTCVSTSLITGSVSIQAESSVAVISTVTVINITIKLATVNTVITGTVSVTAHCVRSATVSMSVTTVKLTVGTELRIDNIVYRIPAETRLYTIVGETRQFSIASETRIHTIQGT